MRRGLESLYVDLILTVIVVSVGSMVLALQSNLNMIDKLPQHHNLAGYLITRNNNNSLLIISNWDTINATVNIFCIKTNESFKVTVPAKDSIVVDVCGPDLIIVSEDHDIPLFYLGDIR